MHLILLQDAVWRVYYRMMKPEIDKYSQNVPKSPIREQQSSGNRKSWPTVVVSVSLLKFLARVFLRESVETTGSLSAPQQNVPSEL